MPRVDNSAAHFAASLVLCVRHPSRRAAGHCDRCGWDLCRACLVADHVCCASSSGSTSRLQRRRPGALATLGVALLAVFTLWFMTAPGRDPGKLADPPPASPLPAVAAVPEPPAPADRPPEADGTRMPDAETIADLQAEPVTPAGGVGSVVTETRDIPPSLAAVPSPERARGNPAPAGAPSTTTFAVSFNRGPLDRREVLLSFDGGSQAAGAEEILNTLSTVGVKTTFFLTGEFIRNHPDLVRRLVAEGHEIGNHTDDHSHLTTWETDRRHHTRPDVNRAWLQAQLSSTAIAFREVTGKELAPLWRAPYGEINSDILRWGQEAGWQHVGWTRSLDSLDWVTDTESAIYRSAAEIARRIVELPRTDRRGGRGAIVLMHLGSDRPHQDRMARVLPQIVAAYRELGFEFVKASAMMRDS